MGVVTPTRHARFIFSGSGHSQREWPLQLAMGVLSSLGVVTPTRHGRSIEWDWPLPRAMGVLYSVGVVTPSRNDSVIYALEASYIPRQIR